MLIEIIGFPPAAPSIALLRESSSFYRKGLRVFREGRQEFLADLADLRRYFLQFLLCVLCG